MSIPKKGSRKIVVDGKEYFWLVRSKPTYTQECFESPMTASVELNQKGVATLNIEFNFQRPDSLVSNNSDAVTPSLIQACILEAIRAGWVPDVPGSTYKYVYKG